MVTTGYRDFGLTVVTGYNWLPELWNQNGYRLPLAPRISDSGWFPVTTSFPNDEFRMITGYHWSRECRTQVSYRLPVVIRIWTQDGYHLLPEFGTG